jgi:precorrin-6B methylase 2
MGDDINLRLRPILQKTLKPGARIVSHRFSMGDWKPDKRELITDKDNTEKYEVLLWRIRDPKEEKSSRLRLLLPWEDAEVTLDGHPYKGNGLERKLTVPILPDTKGICIVKAAWEPNNYTHITRTLKVTLKEDAETVADLRKAIPSQPDDIEVIYVPTPDEVVDIMCKMAKVGPKDVVYDLGCGDGRIVIHAVKKYKAMRGVGIDLDPDRVTQSKENASTSSVTDKVEIRQGDVLKIKDLSEATVVMLYMGEDINLRLRPILKKTLRPGARIVSHRFTMGDWKPERTEKWTSPLGEEYFVHLWTIGSK